MENAIWLPRLEPQFLHDRPIRNKKKIDQKPNLKCNPRMVNDSMVVDIHQIATVNS